MKKIHAAKCPRHNCNEVQLSLDGIQESKSSSITTDAFSITFGSCTKVYPLRLIRPINKFKYDEQKEIKNVIDDIVQNSIIITCAVCDNPKRAILRCALCHSSTYACEYCEASAVLVQDVLISSTTKSIKKKYDLRRKSLQNTIDFLKESPGTTESKRRDELKIAELTNTLNDLEREEETEINNVNKKRLAWPYSTINGILRTTDLIKYIVRKIERNEELTKHEKKGFKGASHLLNLENFNFINCIHAEYMHLACLGTTKRLVELTFDVGEVRKKTSKRKLSEASKFNHEIRKVQVFREFSRRCRNLDLSIIKAQEYRNIILFMYPIVIDCIDSNYPKEKIVWLNLAYILRACVLPNIEFNCIDKENIKRACNKFYSLFEKCFGEINCTYSVHVTSAHILRVRGDEPLTARSAFKFESFYSEMKNLFHPGSSSTLKQILQNTLMKRSLESHSCSKPIKYSCVKNPNTGLENDSMIYIFNEKKTHDFYSINKINENNTFQCTLQGRFEHNCPLTPEIDWSSVGVYKVGPSSSTVKTIKKSEIHGKVIKVKDYLLTCPINVLQEQ